MDQNEINLWVCEDGQWGIVDRYEPDDRDHAIVYAKRRLESPRVSGVRVMHEYFDPATQEIKHDQLFRVVKAGSKATNPATPDSAPSGPARGQAAPAPKKAEAPPPAAPAPAPKPAPAPAPVVAKKKVESRAPKQRMSIGKRLVVAGGTSAVAAVAGPVLMSSNITADVLAGMGGSGAIYMSALGIFLATFGTVLFFTGRGEAPEVEPPEPGAADIALGLDSVPTVRTGALIEAVAAPPFEGVAAIGQEAEKEKEKAKRAAPPKQAQEQRLRLLAFLQDCLSDKALVKYLPQGELDAKNRFGFHLFMLGAGQACIAALGKTGKLRLSDIVETALGLLGSDPEKARSFAEEIAEYQKEAKSAAMIRAGDAAMSAFLKENKLNGSTLSEALQVWNAVDREGGDAAILESSGQDVAIMFTDMVSSVETTMKLGEAGMMLLVEAHNLIIGSVLKTHRGHQVKHTGDGIMAVFPRVADGVAAAAEMQRQIAEHNSATAGNLLKIRIGLSAGNPIRKDDDYFGTVVQTAARVCAVAGNAEIAVPDSITRMPGCERFAYGEPRSVPLKGFPEPQIVRMVMWSDGAGAPQAALAGAD